MRLPAGEDSSTEKIACCTVILTNTTACRTIPTDLTSSFTVDIFDHVGGSRSACLAVVTGPRWLFWRDEPTTEISSCWDDILSLLKLKTRSVLIALLRSYLVSSNGEKYTVALGDKLTETKQ